jgi:hypothetical protein
MTSAGALVRDLSEYSTETLDYALKSLAGDDYERLTEVLEITKNDLKMKNVTSPEQLVSKSMIKNQPKQPPPAVVFKEYVLPQILSGLARYEINDDKWSTIDVNIHFKNNYSAMSESEKIRVHLELLKQESNSETVLLFIKRERGLLYWWCCKDMQKDKNVEEWFKNAMGVVYNRAIECINFAKLTALYPRLLVCGLCWTQLLKHNKRIINFVNLKENLEIKERLKRPISVKVQGNDCILEDATEEEAIEHEIDLQHATNSKYDADNHFIYPTEECEDYEIELDDGDVCRELNNVTLG